MARTNILIITTDQQRTDSLSCYGSTFTSTPNVDRLASEGVRFDRAYCSNPVCTPARVSIFTGQNVGRHGVWNVGMNTPARTVLISHRLAEAGYRTHYVGKAHFQAFGADARQSVEATAQDQQQRYPKFAGPYYGFQTAELALGHVTYGLAGHYGAWVRSQVTAEQFESFRSADRQARMHFGGEAFDWDLPTRLHNSVWTADRTIEFLQGCDRQQPFLLAVGFQDPHHPHAVPRDLPAALRVDPADVPPPRWAEGELDDKPPTFNLARQGKLSGSRFAGKYRVAGQGGGADYRDVDPDDARRGRAYYYTMVRLIDQQIGRILDCLDATGQADNTLIVFTTDHGELLGDHGLWMKGPLHYEQLVRIPLVMRWPGGFAPRPASGALISQVDIAATALAAAEAPLPDDLDGRSALPMLTGRAEAIRDAAIVECVDDPSGLRLKTIVTVERKLTWYAGQPFGELYDLAVDPGERTNLWDDPRYAGEKATLLGRLLQEIEAGENARCVERIAYA